MKKKSFSSKRFHLLLMSYLLLQLTSKSGNSWMYFPVYFDTSIWCAPRVENPASLKYAEENRPSTQRVILPYYVSFSISWKKKYCSLLNTNATIPLLLYWKTVNWKL